VERLREEVVALGPWHLDVEIAPGLSTAAFLDAPQDAYPESFGAVTFRNPRAGFVKRIMRLFPNGLEGRTVMDCACNCGAYLFWAKELGAGECFGFDVRGHWIDQARFLARSRSGPGADIRFEVRDLYDLPGLGLDQFDVTLFHGILYHLPEPVAGLKVAADLTRELMIVNTAARTDLPDGALVASEEGRVEAMSGVYGLNWFPTGPDVLASMLAWTGFPETRTSRWRRSVENQPGAMGRIETLAARDPATFESFDRPLDPAELADAVRLVARIAVPEGARVLVAGAGWAALELEGRTALPLSMPDGAGPADRSAGEELVAELESRREEGIEFLLVPAPAIHALERIPAAADHLGSRWTLEFRELGVCDVWSAKRAD
jgi:SAM-dependent methyltransferase